MLRKEAGKRSEKHCEYAPKKGTDKPQEDKPNRVSNHDVSSFRWKTPCAKRPRELTLHSFWKKKKDPRTRCPRILWRWLGTQAARVCMSITRMFIHPLSVFYLPSRAILNAIALLWSFPRVSKALRDTLLWHFCCSCFRMQCEHRSNEKTPQRVFLPTLLELW